MKLEIFSIYDSKADSFSTPVFLANEAVAKRHFAQGANSPESHLNANPEDYTLFHLGSWDNENGAFETLLTPRSLGLAASYVVASQPANPV